MFYCPARYPGWYGKLLQRNWGYNSHMRTISGSSILHGIIEGSTTRPEGNCG